MSKWFLFLVNLLAAIQIGCSVYKSAGRKAFESVASDRVTNVSGSAKTAPKMEVCWQQSSQEPLYIPDPQQTYRVQHLNTDLIEVCHEE